MFLQPAAPHSDFRNDWFLHFSRCSADPCKKDIGCSPRTCHTSPICVASLNRIAENLALCWTAGDSRAPYIVGRATPKVAVSCEAATPLLSSSPSSSAFRQGPPSPAPRAATYRMQPRSSYPAAHEPSSFPVVVLLFAGTELHFGSRLPNPVCASQNLKVSEALESRNLKNR